MLPNSINRTLKRLAKKAGIEKNIHNHSLRHLWATCMLDNNVPIENIQLCMGHSDISVTTRYAKIRNAQKVVRETMEIEVF
jgi:site-specific recombinase XerD